MAETGTIVVVESEGNGRMCLTLPQVLVTVVGIEKLVPTWQDLEVFMQLLPRSSTAERMNPYTSTWTGVTPGDGPHRVPPGPARQRPHRHPGRPVGRTALRCIRCSACLNVCPVYERTGGRAYGSVYPGPIGAVLTPQLRGINQHPVDAQTASLPYASSLCGACFDACPVRIDIPDLLVHLRAKVVDHKRATRRLPGGEQLAMTGAALVLGSPGRLAAAQRLAGLAGRVLGRGGRLRRLPGPGWVGAWFGSRDLPAPPARVVPRLVEKNPLAPRDAPVSATRAGPRARDEIHAAGRRRPGRPAPARAGPPRLPSDWPG